MTIVDSATEPTTSAGERTPLTRWLAVAAMAVGTSEDRTIQFEPEAVVITGERATVRWRYHFGDGPTDSVRGVSLTNPCRPHSRRP
ncbi:hypothetical protein OG535_29945 [Kitasatospora sp. NBC_00085]|uniref:hypothetical protein n=1 Tax=Kitasatospora sp. NBC_00085 TaxID=2903566 RepID=UPI00324EFE96